MSAESIAMDTGSRGVSVPDAASEAVASNFRLSFESHARRPATASATNTIRFDMMASRGGSGVLSEMTISLTAH
jgi:hypothetical protein